MTSLSLLPGRTVGRLQYAKFIIKVSKGAKIRNRYIQIIFFLYKRFIYSSNESSIILNGVDEPFIDQIIRHHCPVVCHVSITKHLYKEYMAYIDRYQEIVTANWNSL